MLLIHYMREKKLCPFAGYEKKVISCTPPSPPPTLSFLPAAPALAPCAKGGGWYVGWVREEGCRVRVSSKAPRPRPPIGFLRLPLGKTLTIWFLYRFS